jgi:phospholipase/carboxylesterase
MKKLILLIIIISFLALLQWWFKDPTIDVPTNNLSFGYIVKYSGNSGRSDSLPMLVALHGNGDSVKNFYETVLDQLNVPTRIILLKGPLSYGTGSAWPWTPDDFDKYGKAVNEAIELLAAKYPTRGKPILLGFSTGGMMAYYQAVKYGDTYSYIFPVSGQLSEKMLGNGAPRSGAEVSAFHGKEDNVISISSGRSAVNVLRSKGIEVNLTEFNSGHHGIFTDMKSAITQAIEQKINSLK